MTASTYELIECAAEALWQKRWRGTEMISSKYRWPDFCNEKPDIAAIYRENARVAYQAIEKARAV